MLNTLRNRLQGEEGFTLVELLVVILIIGILAAIAIPSFLNQKGKGEDAAAKSAVREASTAMETYYTDNGDYSGATGTKLRTIESTLPPDAATAPAGASLAEAGNMLVTSTTTGYSVKVFSKPSGRMYEVAKNSSGIVSRNCAVIAVGDNAGGCKVVSGTTAGSW